MLAIVFKLFKKNLFLNIVMILQISLCVILSNSFIGIFNGLFQSNYLIDYFADAKMFSAIDNNTEITSQDKEKLESYNCSVEFTYNPCFFEDYAIFTYENRTIGIMKNFLKFGKWFDECENIDSDAIKTVVISDNKSLIGTYVTKTIEGKEYKFYVTGSFGADLFFIITGMGGSNSSAYFEPYKTKNTNNIGFVFESDSTPDFVTKSSYGLVYIDEMYYNETMDILDHYIDSYLDIIDFKVQDKSVFDKWKALIEPFMIAFGVLGTISLITMIFLSINKNQKLFASFYKVGMSRKNIILMGIWYFMFVVLGVALFSSVFMILLKKILIEEMYCIFNFKNTLFNIGIAMILFVVTEIVFLLSLKRRMIENE